MGPLNANLGSARPPSGCDLAVLVNEFPKSEHLQDAQKRIAELQATQASNEKKS